MGFLYSTRDRDRRAAGGHGVVSLYNLGEDLCE